MGRFIEAEECITLFNKQLSRLKDHQFPGHLVVELERQQDQVITHASTSALESWRIAFLPVFPAAALCLRDQIERMGGAEALGLIPGPYKVIEGTPRHPYFIFDVSGCQYEWDYRSFREAVQHFPQDRFPLAPEELLAVTLHTGITNYRLPEKADVEGREASPFFNEDGFNGYHWYCAHPPNGSWRWTLPSCRERLWFPS